VYRAALRAGLFRGLIVERFVFREEKLKLAALWANKYLHLRDMEYLQDLCVTVYDWGGISSSSEPNGIDKFKMSFGGHPVRYYNITWGHSVKQKLFNKIENRFLRRGKKK
jgi:hypothetical protein